MAYTITREWYGLEGYQWGWRYHPPGHVPGTDPALPLIIYRPGGGWAGADQVDLNARHWFLNGLNDASSPHQETYALFVIQTASIGYNRVKATGNTAWATATAYTIDAYRQVLGRTYACIRAHTSAATDEPGVGVNWQQYWRECFRNETIQRQVGDFAETTPGGLDEMVTNVQQAVAFARRNAGKFGWDANKVVLAGASAGGQMVGCAAYAEDRPYARLGQVHGASLDAAQHSSRPNAAILSITPVDLRLHTGYGLLNGLYGVARSDPEWQALSTVDKDAMSPQRVLERTGMAIPTMLDYAAFGYHGDGLAGPNPYHHPDNGWQMLQTLQSARPTGFARTDCRFLENDPVGGGFRMYSAYNGTPTNVGTTGLQLADTTFTWLNGVLGV